MTYPPTGEPNESQYFGGYPAPSGPSPTGAFPAQPGQGQPAAPGYPPQYAAPQYPPQQPAGYPPQPPPTQAWQQAPATQAPATQGWQQAPAPQAPATQGWQQAPTTQAWQPPAGPPPAAPRSSMPWVPIGVIAGILVLAVAGGAFVVSKLVGNSDPSTPDAGGQPAVTAGVPTAPGLPTDHPLKSSSQAAAPAKYTAPGDLCSIDLSALGPYAAKKEKSTPNVRKTGDVARSDCDLDLRTSSGMKVTFGIKTQVYPSAKDAKEYYDSGYEMDKKRFFDGELSGMGERAYGTNRDWDIGSKTSDYTIRVLDSNLYLSVSLVTFGTSFVPKDQLKPKAVDEVKAILAKLPTA
ncbi:hypothetical protein AB0M46_26525 [Dactylosporangium sp. NPDC051485]|uniref:hypothetical protein n=1 Tax=Dactylosporangium sp. NPDC051485 TaxID=3154846 RepID=UPI0034258F27